MVYTCNWGILACGGIATSFSKDLLLDPKTRGVTDVQNKIVAVASSTSKQKAEDFVTKITEGKGDPSIRAYGSYDDLVKDKDVHIIYVASPHSHHYQHVLLCLRAGKNVLCEKSFVVNSKQCEHLIKEARERKLFLMEAVWTRCFPIVLEIQKLIHQDKVLGRIHRVISDLSIHFPYDPNHRLINPDLAGGALLDLGIYALTWQMIALHQHPDNKRKPPHVAAGMLKHKKSGVDEHTTIVLDFPEMHAQGIAMSSMTQNSNQWDAHCHIQGDKGELVVGWGPFRPEWYELKIWQLNELGRPTGPPEVTRVSREIPGKGMFWEADECARCLRDGKLESDIVPLADTQLTTDIMDEVRRIGDFKYPDALEAVEDF